MNNPTFLTNNTQPLPESRFYPAVGESILSYLIILVVCFFAFIANNRIIPADLMESRNLATAQEMVRTGNYMIPTMNGELRLEKPPLPTWIAAGVEHILPDNLAAQRCVAGIFATAMVFFLFFLVRRLTHNHTLALTTSVILAGCFNVVLLGRTATWDIFCHSFMLGAIYFLTVALQEKGRQWRRFIWAGLFMGLSFLSKGPVSFYALLLPFLIGYCIVFRANIKEKVLPLAFMVVTCLLISFWWPVYIALFHSEVGLAIAKKESTAWIGHNVRPFYYYWKFPAEAGIWALFWVTSLFYFFWKKNEKYRKAYSFSILWTIAAFVLLSVIPEKKTRYLLPLLIPGAVNISFYIYYCTKVILTRGEKTLFRANVMPIILILLALPPVLYLKFVKEGLLSWPVYILAIILAVGLAVFIVIALFDKKKIRVMWVFAGIASVMVLVEAFCLSPIGNMFINEHRHSIRTLRNDPTVRELPFYYDKQDLLRIELVYEVDRVIRPMDVENDSLIYASLPFVFIGEVSAARVFEREDIKIERIDTFDNNWRKQNSKRRDKSLIREVSVISRYEASGD